MTVSITLGTRGLSRTSQERRRQLARMRRAARMVSAPEARDELQTHDWVVMTADGPRKVRVDHATYLALKSPIDESVTMTRTLHQYGEIVRVTNAGLNLARLSDEYEAGKFEPRRWVHHHDCATDGCPQGTMHYAATGDRRAAKAWIAPAGVTVDMVKAQWAQNRAGVEAQRALWRAKRRDAIAKRAHGEDAKVARKAGRRAQAFARQLADLVAQRAALTAASVARGELTND